MVRPFYKETSWRPHLYKLCHLHTAFSGCPMAGGLGEDRELTIGIVYLHWPGDTLGSPRRIWRVSQGREMCGFSSWICCICDLTTDKPSKIELGMICCQVTNLLIQLVYSLLHLLDKYYVFHHSNQH